jgi:GMP synthase (glutamine-hydrolysing)
MILLIDNTKNLKDAFMTPKLLACLEKTGIKFMVASTRTDVNTILDTYIKDIKGIILSGGPLCLSEELTISLINKNIAVVLRLKNIPILGICFGFQLLVASYGGNIVSMDKESKGVKKVQILSPNSPIFNNINNEYIDVFQSHKDTVNDVPPNFDIIAIDENNIIQGIENKQFNIWGFQFHPEGLDSTTQLIYNFLDICDDR